MFLCSQYRYAALGEIIFSVLGQSYIETSKGFNSTEAGKFVASVHEFDTTETWERFSAAALPTITKNMKAERGRIEESREQQ